MPAAAATLLGTSERSFLTGLGSFFGAHVAYLAAFLSVRSEVKDYDAAGLEVAAGLWLTATPLMSFAAGRRDPALRVPVAAYATILSAMFATSHMLDRSLPPAARATLQAGTALFLVSDTVLAVQKFVLAEPRPVLDAVVMTTYTAAQRLIAAGVAARPELVTPWAQGFSRCHTVGKWTVTPDAAASSSSTRIVTSRSSPR